MNFHRRRLHHTVYYTLDSNKELLIILLFHVDDFLVAFREDCHFDEGLFMFIFGQKNLVDDDDFVLKGKTVSFKKVEGEFHIQVMQKAFIGETRKLKPNRPAEPIPLSSEEMRGAAMAGGKHEARHSGHLSLQSRPGERPGSAFQEQPCSIGEAFEALD